MDFGTGAIIGGVVAAVITAVYNGRNSVKNTDRTNEQAQLDFLFAKNNELVQKASQQVARFEVEIEALRQKHHDSEILRVRLEERNTILEARNKELEIRLETFEPKKPNNK